MLKTNYYKAYFYFYNNIQYLQYCILLYNIYNYYLIIRKNQFMNTN